MGQETSKILVVDDDMRLRSLLERYLLEQGYQVRSAANAEQMDRLLERRGGACGQQRRRGLRRW